MSAADDPERRSRLLAGSFCVFGDLHNHSLFSDGSGDPERAFAQIRTAGLDVAALTDHASIPSADIDALDPADYPHPEALRLARSAPRSLDAAAWERTRLLADRADEPGEFTAIRGFEWTEPWVGHANVWFSDAVLHVDTPGRISGLHRFLLEDEPGAVFGYNHPGREAGRFGDFALAPDLVPRLVSLEMFNRHDDYLFEGVDQGRPSPLVACLAAGWRPGLVGVSDEHSSSYGLVGKGRTGLWVHELSRAGVREALLARRTYATREAGLLLAATLDGVPAGGEVAASDAGRELAVDVRGLAPGAAAELQVLGPGGEGLPALVTVVPVLADASGAAVLTAAVPPGSSPWLVARLADPARRNRTSGPAGHPGNSYALACASPWYVS